MRGKKARKLRNRAYRLTVGEDKTVTRQFYQLLKRKKC